MSLKRSKHYSHTTNGKHSQKEGSRRSEEEVDLRAIISKGRSGGGRTEEGKSRKTSESEDLRARLDKPRDRSKGENMRLSIGENGGTRVKGRLPEDDTYEESNKHKEGGKKRSSVVVVSSNGDKRSDKENDRDRKKRDDSSSDDRKKTSGGGGDTGSHRHRKKKKRQNRSESRSRSSSRHRQRRRSRSAGGERRTRSRSSGGHHRRKPLLEKSVSSKVGKYSSQRGDRSCSREREERRDRSPHSARRERKRKHAESEERGSGKVKVSPKKKSKPSVSPEPEAEPKEKSAKKKKKKEKKEKKNAKKAKEKKLKNLEGKEKSDMKITDEKDEGKEKEDEEKVVRRVREVSGSLEKSTEQLVVESAAAEPDAQTLLEVGPLVTNGDLDVVAAERKGRKSRIDSGISTGSTTVNNQTGGTLGGLSSLLKERDDKASVVDASSEATAATTVGTADSTLNMSTTSSAAGRRDQNRKLSDSPLNENSLSLSPVRTVSRSPVREPLGSTAGRRSSSRGGGAAAAATIGRRKGDRERDDSLTTRRDRRRRLSGSHHRRRRHSEEEEAAGRQAPDQYSNYRNKEDSRRMREKERREREYSSSGGVGGGAATGGQSVKLLETTGGGATGDSVENLERSESSTVEARGPSVDNSADKSSSHHERAAENLDDGTAKPKSEGEEERGLARNHLDRDERDRAGNRSRGGEEGNRYSRDRDSRNNNRDDRRPRQIGGDRRRGNNDYSTRDHRGGGRELSRDRRIDRRGVRSPPTDRTKKDHAADQSLLPRPTRDASPRERDYDARDRNYGGGDRYRGSRRYSGEYRGGGEGDRQVPRDSRYRGGRYHNGDHRDGDRDYYYRGGSGRYSLDDRASLMDGPLKLDNANLAWEDKVNQFLEGVAAVPPSNLVELPRARDPATEMSTTTGLAAASFDPSKPPPLTVVDPAAAVPDYAVVAAYRDPSVPELDLGGGGGGHITTNGHHHHHPQHHLTAGGHPPAYNHHQHHSSSPPYLAAASAEFPPLHRAPPTDLAVASYRPEMAFGRSVDPHQRHAEVSPPPPEQKEEPSRPLTLKERKKVETGQKEVWQHLAKKLLGDPIFMAKRRKKKGGAPEDKDDAKEKAEKCAVRIALKLEKSGFSEARLWRKLRENERGSDGLYDELRAAVMSNTIEIDKDARKPKDKLDAELFLEGSIFKYIGEYIQANLSQLTRPAAGGVGSVRRPSGTMPSTNDLQTILQTAKTVVARTSPVPTTVRPEHLVPEEGETAFNFALRTFQDLKNFIAVQLTSTLKMEVDLSRQTALHYVETLALADFNYKILHDTVTNYEPPEPEFEGEPVQSVYGHLLDCLRNVPFERVPRALSDTNLDKHQTNIVRITLEYFAARPRSGLSGGGVSPQPSLRTVEPEEPGFIGPVVEETVPVGGNTVNQLPQRRYVLVSVSVDTVPVDGRLVVWQISVHIPSLPDTEDPDYECLMLPLAIKGRDNILSDVGFTYDPEKATYYHHGTVFGRRRAEAEEVSLEKFTNYLDEIRSGLKGAGQNNGLVLLFETGEDLALVRQLLGRHGHEQTFLDVVKGVGCLDHYLRATRSSNGGVNGGSSGGAYTWPAYQHRVGCESGRWLANLVTAAKAGPPQRIDAETKAECVYNIAEALVGAPPTYENFVRWFCYPVGHPEVRGRMTASLEHTLELLPLQNHIDRQLYSSRAQVTLEGVFAARSEVEAARPCSACARQTVRRLVSLGFTLEVLKKSFRADPGYEIPSSVFLQDMTEVQKLRVHAQTDQIRSLIKQFFVQPVQAAPGYNNHRQ